MRSRSPAVCGAINDPPASSSEISAFRKIDLIRTAAYPSRTIHFDLAAGEILGLAGLVGAGRSDVARAIFGTEPALEGEIILDGLRLAIRSPRDAIRHGIYLVPEDRRLSGLITEMTV